MPQPINLCSGRRLVYIHPPLPHLSCCATKAHSRWALLEDHHCQCPQVGGQPFPLAGWCTHSSQLRWGESSASNVHGWSYSGGCLLFAGCGLVGQSDNLDGFSIPLNRELKAELGIWNRICSGDRSTKLRSELLRQGTQSFASPHSPWHSSTGWQLGFGPPLCLTAAHTVLPKLLWVRCWILPWLEGLGSTS